MADQQVSITAVLIDKISGPGSAIRGFFTGFKADLKSVVGQSSGVTSALAAIATSLLSVAAANKALHEAELSVQTEQRLLGALRGRVDEFDRLVKLASDFQKKTQFSDESILNVAILLIQAGKNGKELDKTLRAVVDTAAALGTGVEEIGRQVIGFQNGVARGISRLVPQLKELDANGTLATEGVNKLLELFSGRGEELGATAFGQATIQANLFSDSLETVGKFLIDIKVAFQTQLNKALAQFVGLISSPAVQAFKKFLVELINQVGGILPLVLGIVAAFTAVSGVVATIVALAATLSSIAAIIASGPLLLIAAKVLLVAGVVAAILVSAGIIAKKVLEIFGLLEPIKRFFGGILKDVNDVFQAVADGKIEVADIFDFIFTKVKNFATLFDAYILNPIARTIAGVIKIILGGSQLLVTALTSTAADFLKFIIELGQDGLRAFAKLIDATTGLIADGLEKLPGVAKETADAVRTSIESVVPKEFTAFDGFIKQQKDGFAGALETFKDGFREFGRIAEDIDKAQAETESNTIALGLRIMQRFIDRARAAAKAQDEAKAKALAVLAEIASLEERIDNVRNRRNAEAIEANRTARLKALEDEFDRELISAADFIAEKEKLEREPFEKKLLQQSALISQQEEIIAKIRQEKGAQADVRAELQTLIELLLDQQKIQDELLAKNEELFALRRKISGTFLSDVKDAETELKKREKEITELFKGGSLTPDEALNEAGKATEAFQAKLEAAKIALDNLLANNPKFKKDLEVLRASLNEFDDTEVDVSFNIAESVFQDLDKSKQKFEKFSDDTRELLSRGLITVGEATKRTTDALAVFDVEIEKTKVAIRKLAAENPEAAKKFNELLEKLEEFNGLDFKTSLGLGDLILKEVEDAQSKLKDIRLDTSNLFDTGAIFKSEAVVRMNAALADFKPKLMDAIATLQIMMALNPQVAASLQPILDKLLKIQQLEFSGPKNSWEDFSRGFSSGFGQVVSQFDDLTVAGQQFGSVVATDIGQGLVSALTDADFSFRNFAGNFLKKIAEMIAQMVIFRAISSAFGFAPVGAASGGQVKAANGGLIKKFDTGGIVPGPNVERDVIPALLMPDEWVIKKRSSQYYGNAIMSALNNMLIPRELLLGTKIPASSGLRNQTARFAGGGQAKGTAFTPLTSAGLGRAHVIAGEQEFERLLAGGGPPLLEWLKNNAGTVNSLLGRV